MQAIDRTNILYPLTNLSPLDIIIGIRKDELKMITLQKQINFEETYPLDRLGDREGLLFFDIETTGFSGDYSTLYLIGCVYYQNGVWNLIQWFADTLDSEKELLITFFEFLKQFKKVVHFNGDGFDIPYLLKRSHAYHLTYDFSGVESLDLYKKIRPYRTLLGLSSMKQKAIEAFLGVDRNDLYSGGELIFVYKDYLISHESFLFDLLILHNEDDLKGMPLILPILNYPDFLEHEFSLVEQELIPSQDLFGRDHHALKLTLKSTYGVPVGFQRSNSMVNAVIEGQELSLTIDLYEGELKYFYPDYKDYYYLIYEDRAIHKSVAEYVDKNARKKATAKNCYMKQTGCYLPQFSPLWTPFLQNQWKDKVTYITYDSEFFKNYENLQRYIRHILDNL